MNKLKKCAVCGEEIASSAKTCPKCGAKNKKPFYKKWWVWAIAVIAVISSMNMNSNTDSNTNSPIVNETSQSTSAPDTQKTEAKEQNESKIPMEYKSALKKAETYSSIMHMSKKAIYNQLTSEYGEKFSTEAAQYAIDNIQADWNENALKKAEIYQKDMNMSPAKIHDQLTSEYGEKFTKEEADYAIANLSK